MILFILFVIHCIVIYASSFHLFRSGASIGKFLSNLEDKVNKIAYRVDEADAWFEEKGMTIENLGTGF